MLSDFEIITQIELDTLEMEADPQEVINSALLTSDVTATEPDKIKQTTPLEEIPSKALKETVNKYEKQLILSSLKECHWQIKRAAEQLSLPISTLNHKMKKYQIRHID